MTTQAEPGGGPLDPSLSAIMNERRQLINLAYRLLGSFADAEDVAQETYARWYAMSREQREAIESPGGWLTKVASRMCLDLLGSARVRRERYVGEWIPEPLPDQMECTNERSGSTSVDPADRVTLDESINMAFLVVLESMTPAERVAFLLHMSSATPFPKWRRSSAVPGGMSPAGHVGSPSYWRVAGSPRLRQPSKPTSSGTSSRLGKPKTSTPSSEFSTQTRRRSPTAAAWSAPSSAQIEGGEQIARLCVDIANWVPNLTLLERTVNGQPGFGGSTRWHHRDGLRIRHRRRPDQAHLGSTNPEKLRPWTTG
jgi:RNA polymerase sigma factor (sigma-70 family)